MWCTGFSVIHHFEGFSFLYLSESLMNLEDILVNTNLIFSRAEEAPVCRLVRLERRDASESESKEEVCVISHLEKVRD